LWDWQQAVGLAKPYRAHEVPLLDLAKIHRVRDDLSGFVDADGLHLRWGKGGGLNLRPQQDADASKIILRMPAPASTVAA